MAGSDSLADRKLHQDVARDLRVEVANGSDLFHGHAFGHQLLFHGHDFRRVGLPDDFPHLSLYLLGGIPRVQVLNDVFQYSNPVRLVVDHFAHDTLLNVSRLRIRMSPAHDFCHTAAHSPRYLAA